MISRAADIGTREKSHDILEPHQAAVQEILILPVAIDDALHHDFFKINIEQPIGIIKYDLHSSTVCAREGGRTAPDEIFAALRAHGLHGLLAENKAERFCNIRFPAPVRTDYPVNR